MEANGVSCWMPSAVQHQRRGRWMLAQRWTPGRGLGKDKEHKRQTGMVSSYGQVTKGRRMPETALSFPSPQTNDQ